MLFKKTFSIALSLIMALTIFSVVPFDNYVKAADEVTLTPSNPSTNDAAFSKFGASLVAGSPTITYRKSTNKGSTWNVIELLQDDKLDVSDREFPSNIPSLYDLNITNSDFMGGFKRWEDADKDGIITKFYGGDTYSTRYRCDIMYDLKVAQTIKDILIIHANRKGDRTILRSGHYAVYVSNDINTIYDDSNKVYEFKNDNTSSVAFSHRLSFNAKKQGRYVALSIYNPYSTTDLNKLLADDITKNAINCYVRLFEFNVFGESGGYKFTRKHEAYSSNYTPILESKKNLIKDRLASSAFVYKDSNINDDQEGKKYGITYRMAPNYLPSTALTDNNAASLEVRADTTENCFFSRSSTDTGRTNSSGQKLYTNDVIDNEKELYYQFNYKLDGTVNITGASVISHTNTLLTASHFKISIANNEDDLFTGSAVYNTPDLYTGCNINELTFNEAKKGSYVGFRIICGVNLDSTTETTYMVYALYARLAELCVYGTYASQTTGVSHSSKIKPLGNKSVNTAITVKYQANPDDKNRYPNGSKADIKAAASVRYDRKLYRFLYWTDKNGKQIGTNQWLENQTLPTVVTAIYGTKDPNDTVKITFADKQGTVLHTATVGFGEYVAREDYEKANSLVPDIAGYQKYCEDTEVGSRTANVQLWDVDIYNMPADSNITVTPLYKVSTTTYKVTVNSAAAQQLSFDTKVNLSQDKNWLVNGVNWHAGNSYTYVTGDMEITSNDTKQYGIALYNPSGKKSPTVQNGTVTTFAKLNLESGAVITECGVLYKGYNGGKAPTDDNFNLGNKDQTIVAKTPTGNHFACALRGVGKKRTRYARAYVKYTLGGQEKTVYSNIIKITT